MKHVLLAVTLAVAACERPIPQPPPIEVGDACERSQATLDRLACPSRATAKGKRWAVVCHELANVGYPPPGECIAAAHSCAEPGLPIGVRPLRKNCFQLQRRGRCGSHSL